MVSNEVWQVYLSLSALSQNSILMRQCLQHSGTEARRSLLSGMGVSIFFLLNRDMDAEPQGDWKKALFIRR
jgi:hypothetical protein